MPDETPSAQSYHIEGEKVILVHHQNGNIYIENDVQTGLILDDLGVDSPLWDRTHFLRFTLSNPGDGILFVDSILLKILRATPCDLLRAPCAGAILKMFEFEVDLAPDQTDYLVCEDFFVYKKGDIDGFRLKLTSAQDYTYDVQVEIEWHSVSDINRQKAVSKIHTISFYPKDIDAAMIALKRRKTPDVMEDYHK